MASVTVTEEQRTYFNEYIKNGAALHQIAIKHGVSLDAVIRAVRLGGLEPSKAEIGAARLEIIDADGQALARERRAAKAVVPLSAKPAPAPKPTPRPPAPAAPAAPAEPKPEPAVVDPEQIVLETYTLFGNVNKAAKTAGVSWPTANKIIEAAGLKQKPQSADPIPTDSFTVENEPDPEPEPVEGEVPEPLSETPTTTSFLIEEALDQIFGALPKTDFQQEETQDMPIPATNSPAPAAQAAPTYKAVLLPENAVPSLQSGLHLIGELDHLLASLVGKVSHARLDVLLTALHSLADAHHTTANPAHAEAASDV